MWKPSDGLHETRYTVPSVLHSTVAVPPVKRRVERSDAGLEDVPDGEGDFGGAADADVDGDADVADNARSTAASSRGWLCAASPLSDVASCQAPSAPAAVPIATHAAVTAAFRHFLIRPLCRRVS
ncbi:hypothetical protein ABZ916_22520 [Streptomyces sp. NPDC046853]|uniref:hypothetical protein n=1 Tax=Streptomyces sp. NPDC046853 TaxID=3154920 RepID=UPI0034089CD6